jgi:hypothetical protein
MSRAIRKEGDKGGEEDVAKSRPVDASGGGRSRSNQPEPTEAAAIAVDRSGGRAERSASVVEGAREGVQVQAQVGQDTTVCDSDARRGKVLQVLTTRPRELSRGCMGPQHYP